MNTSGEKTIIKTVTDPEPPTLPDVLATDAWTLRDETVETVQKTMGVSVVSATQQFEDRETREALRAATDDTIDAQVRFFAGSNIEFSPSLPLGMTAKMAAPTIRSEAHDEFVGRLERQALQDVTELEESERNLDGDRTAHVTEFSATHPLSRDVEDTLPLTCWLAVWVDDGAARVVTAGHPSVELADHLGLNGDHPELARSPTDYREEFFEMVNQVE